MRAPSLGVSSSDQAVTVMQPPVRDNPAVTVATLPAVAPSPMVVNTKGCWVEDPPANRSMQSEIPVESLNAFASASFQPDVDETDCHAMAMLRQRSSMGATSESSSVMEHDEIPPPRSFNSIGGTSDAGGTSEAGGSVSSSTANNKGGLQTKISSSIARGMVMLFGDAKPSSERESFDNETAAKFVVPRTLLPWSVIHSEATGMWVATVNTNQKALESKNVIEASKSLRAFSVVSEKQATCLARAWSPPKMHHFSKNPACHICYLKFAVFRRACHCRNCGVCICTSCAVPWPSKMLPETMNLKQESFLNICKSCDWLCTTFRLALLEGDLDKAIALHATGNINLVTPFANVKGELLYVLSTSLNHSYSLLAKHVPDITSNCVRVALPSTTTSSYPVHCAVLGGNLAILKWLVDDNCCPIKSVRVSGRCRDASNSFTEISTSKGRSLLGIALENRNVGIMRYLVVEKGIQLTGEKDINMDTLCRNLDLVLRLLPEEASRNTGNATAGGLHLAALAEETSSLHESLNNNTAREMRAINDNASDTSLNDGASL